MGDNNPNIQTAYNDHSLEPFNDEEAVVTDVPKAGNTAHFPSQLYIMLTNANTRGYSHICSWQPHGRAFKVWDRGAFVKKVLPQYFRQVMYMRQTRVMIANNSNSFLIQSSFLSDSIHIFPEAAQFVWF